MIEELKTRLDRLEAQNRALRRGLMAVTLLLLAAPLLGLAGGRSASAPLRARAFEVVDEAGKVRASLSLTTNGGAALQVIDEAGVPRVSLGVGSVVPRFETNSEPFLRFRAGDRKVVVSLMESPYGIDGDGKKTGGPSLSLYQRDGQAGFSAAVENNGKTEAGFFDSASGVPRLITGLAPDGSPHLWMYGRMLGFPLSRSSALPSVVLQADAKGAGSAELYGSDAKKVWRAP